MQPISKIWNPRRLNNVSTLYVWKTGGIQTHDDSQHSILMDANLFSYQQNVRAAISQSMLDYIRTCCATKREARHTRQIPRRPESLKKKNKHFWFQVFFFLPEIGRWIEMQSMIIFLLFRLPWKTKKINSNRRRRRWRAGERDKTESKHKTPHFEMPPRDSLKQNRTRGWCWFRRGRFFFGEETRGSTSVRVLLDPGPPILCDSQHIRWIHHSFSYSHGGQLLYRGGDCFLVVHRGGGWIPPPLSNCLLKTLVPYIPSYIPSIG